MSSNVSVNTPPLRRKPGAGRKSINYADSPASDRSTPLQPRHDNLPLDEYHPVNDDKSEKAIRRKSTHFGQLGVEGKPRMPSGAVPAGGNGANGGNGLGPGGKRTVSALGMQQQKRAKRLSAVVPSGPPVSMEVMHTNFEEWMKLATDNKITATNTWNFALIDYFADLTLLRNGPDDQSINFQKASCTLDGCVKIWTSRVDSVATETGKLLSGLAGGESFLCPEEEIDQTGDGDEEENGEPSTKRKASMLPSFRRSEATLAKSFSVLQVKKFDLEFTVDPLFKKTSADFDEGGAMGLLMNHLGVDGRGRVVFDAGDATIEEEDEGDLPEDEQIDLTKLKEYLPPTSTMEELQISNTLGDFRFSSDPDAMPDFATLVGLKDLDDEPMLEHMDEVSGEGGAHDFFGDENFDVPMGMEVDDGMSVVEGDSGDMEDGIGDGNGGLRGGLQMLAPGDSHGPFDPRRQGGELVMSMMEGDDGMFDYFDKGFGKAWAGAEHWKLRKVSRKDQALPATTRTTKVAKQPFQIDFLSLPGPSSKTLFGAASKSSISLPSTKRERGKRGNDARKRKEEYLLPDDMHFSSRQLLRLFMKPKFSLRMRRNAVSTRMAENPNGEIDENFWAQAAADRAEGDVEMEDNPAPNPFESQFFHDDATDAGDYADVDDVLDPDTAYGEEEDLWQGSQGIELKKSRPENVNFAKKAKRVDVKRLKDDIWKGLRGLVPDTEEVPTSEDEPQEVQTPKEEVKTFDTIITSLRSSYPQEKMSEISTSFCFICLLHLANEEGLRIETARFDGKDGEDVGCQGLADGVEVDDTFMRKGKLDEGEKMDRIVGELQALKVFKDPNAGRAA
ncbi:hypothetical protein M231_03656 [Tremella mesenterica]|uniref:Condensin complex subunit 2 n=1 Tax=Tremella mesenterica TaxID=5217 RepID=A0A4Q1BMY6_TREME|nr:hypothetical protein M231_03656 [Tremella mesenterica]